MKLINKYWHVGILILMSLIPLVWFWDKGDVLINGLDTNFPLDPIIWFKRRFFVWNDTINAGIDASSSVAGLFFHFVQVVPYSLGFSLKITEIFSMIFWFGAIVSASYYFITSIIKENKIARLLFVLVYSFNIYLYNTWENVKVSNLALVVGLPLFLGLAVRRNNDKLTRTKFMMLAGLFSIVASGSGINPGYMITFLGALFIYTIVESFIHKEKWSKFIRTFISISLIVVITNAYWILPLFRFLFISKGASGPEDIGFTNWIHSLSENTSILNVIRLQGAWDWYATDRFGFPLYTPYALNYFKNVPFIVFSFALPFIAILSLVLRRRKSKSIYIFWGIMMALGAFLGAGVHPPTGRLFTFLAREIPYFVFFRSPWYIFTPYLIIAYSGLLALLYERLAEKYTPKNSRINSKVLLLYGATLIFVVGHLLYSYPLISGKVFRPGRYDSFFVSFPEYVTKTGELLDENNKGGRVVMYPDDQLETFTWGYRGTESIISLFASKEAIAPSFAFEGKVLGNFLKVFYRRLKIGEFESASKMLSHFNIGTLMVKNDSTSTAPKIKGDVGDLKKTKIGEWLLYEDKDFEDRKIFAASGYYGHNLSDIDYASILPILNPDYAAIRDGDSEASRVKNIDLLENRITKAENSTFERDPASNIQKFDLSVKEGIYTIALEKNGLDADEISIASPTISFSDSTIKDTQSFVLFEDVFISDGNHSVTVTYPESENLVAIEKMDNKPSVLGLREDELPSASSTLVAYKIGGKEEWIFIPVDDFDPFVNYLFSYNYKYFYGSVAIIDLVQEDERIIYKVLSNYTGSDSDWAYRSLVINPVEVKSKMSVIIRMPSKDLGSRSKSFFENISIRRVNDNKLFLIENKRNEVSTPLVTFEKISPVEYEVDISSIEDNYTVAFLENYSSDWVLTTDSGVESAPHFTVNGYANAWNLSSAAQNQKARIYYKGQDYLKLGAGLSVLGFTFLFTFPVIVSLYEKRKKNSR